MVSDIVVIRNISGDTVCLREQMTLQMMLEAGCHSDASRLPRKINPSEVRTIMELSQLLPFMFEIYHCEMIVLW